MSDLSPERIEDLLIAVARPDAGEDSPERKAAWDEIKRRDAALREAQEQRDFHERNANSAVALLAEREAGIARLRKAVAGHVRDAKRRMDANARLREAIAHVVNDSPGTPHSVKRYLSDALAVSPPADEAKLDGPYRIVLDFDGTEVVWSSMYAREREFRLRSGAESIARHRAAVAPPADEARWRPLRMGEYPPPGPTRLGSVREDGRRVIEVQAPPADEAKR